MMIGTKGNLRELLPIMKMGLKTPQKYTKKLPKKGLIWGTIYYSLHMYLKSFNK